MHCFLLKRLAACCAQGSSYLLVEVEILLYTEQYFKTINPPALVLPVESMVDNTAEHGKEGNAGFVRGAPG